MPTLYVTVPPSVAHNIAYTLVEDGLAACVNRTSVESVYRWDGDVQEETEVVLLIKTSSDRVSEARERIITLHPHDVPCIEQFDEDWVLPEFDRWRQDSTRDRERDEDD